MFSIPIFTSGTYMTDDYNAQKAAVKQIENAILRASGPQDPFLEHTFTSIFIYFESASIPLTYGNITRSSELAPDTVELILEKGKKNPTAHLRNDEFVLESSDQTVPVTTFTTDPVSNDKVGWTWTVQLTFETKKTAVLGAWLGIGRTIFVCLILTISVLKLSRDSEILVINPLEKMVRNVRKISLNPLEAAELDEKEAEHRETLEKNFPDLWQDYKEQNEYEPAMLEKIIVKIGTLEAKRW